MKIALAAPRPVPYVTGGAEVLWRDLAAHINSYTPHRAEIVDVNSEESGFWELIDSYKRFSQLDLTDYDVVISGKYPGWMVEHPRHLCYMLHRLRGLYDTYHLFGLPEKIDRPPRVVSELQQFMATMAGRREALPELFDRLDTIRRSGRIDEEMFRFPGPLIRSVVHFLDGVGLAPEAIRRYGAISHTVRERPGYFPVGARPFVAHPAAGLDCERTSHGNYLFTASRLDGAKRVDLLVEAVRRAPRRVKLRVAGTGPDERRLRRRTRWSRRIIFEGRASPTRLRDLFAAAHAVAYIPMDEDFGLVTLEGMRCAKPVLTCIDSGGPTELVAHGETGLVTKPDPDAIACAIAELWSDRAAARRMGELGRQRAGNVTWDPLIAEIEALG